MRTTKTALLSIASLLAFTSTLLAQDHLIENQRYVVGIDDFSWGDTYVGKYTSGNGLILEEYINSGSTNPITLQISSLQIGSESNFLNTVEIYKGGELQIEGAFTVLGTNNGNGLLVDDQGTLFVKSDFDAAMGGFYYNAGANLKVGGEISHLDDVENGLNFTLTGENTTWAFGTNILMIGASTDSNSVTITDNAQMAIDNLSIGSGSTTSNEFIIANGGRALVNSNITIAAGTGNSLSVTNGGWLEVGMDFDTGMSGFELQTGGGLEAHRNLTMDAISNGIYIVLDGTNAMWDRTGLAMDIGSSTNLSGNSLTVRNGAHAKADQLNLGSFSDRNLLTITNNGTVAVNQIIIGATNTQDNAVLITTGGNLILEGSDSFINASNSLTLVEGGKLTIKGDFTNAISKATDASFYWGNGGILEMQGAAPIFSATTVNDEYIEYGTLFLQRGQILMLNGSNATWNATDHNLHVGDLSSGNALIVTNGANANVKSMTIGDFQEGGHGNSVLISGLGSEIHSLGDVEVGGRFLFGEWIDGGSNNTLRLENGGRLVSDGNFRMGGYNNTFSIDGASSDFSLSGDMFFNGTSQQIEIENGAVLTNSAFTMIGDGHSTLVNGADSLLASHADMSVTGSDNLIRITDGGMITNGGAFSMTGDASTLLIVDSGSRLAASADLVVNGMSNTVWVADGGRLTSGEDLTVSGNGTYVYAVSNGVIDASGDISLNDIKLDISNNGRVASGATLYNQDSEIFLHHEALLEATNYYQSAGALLNYDIGNIPTNLGMLVITDTAEFESGTKIGLIGSLTNLALNTTYTNTLVEAGTLIVGTNINAVTDDLALIDTSDSTLAKFLLYVENQNIIAILNRITLAESAGLSPGSMMWDIANEIDSLSLSGNGAAGQQIDILNGMSGSQQKLQLNQLYAYQLPTYMHNQGIFGGIDQVRARGSSFHGNNNSTPLARPSGVSGPPGLHSGSQELQPWIKVYGSYGNRDEDNNSGFVDGYDVQAYGTVLGVDKSFGSLLLGVAGGYAGSNLEGDNNDKSDATTGYGLIYGSFGTNDWFGDVVLSYGLTDMDNESGGAFDVKSSVEASQTAFYIGGGKEYKDPDGSDARLRPLFGLQVSLYDQDAYSETSTTAVGKEVDAYERWSYQTTLGVSMMIPTKGVKANYETEFRAYWLHEFNDDEETVDYTLVGSSQPGQFILRAPDQNVGQFGLGFMADCKTGLKLRLDLDGQVSKTFTSATVSGALLYEF